MSPQIFIYTTHYSNEKIHERIYIPYTILYTKFKANLFISFYSVRLQFLFLFISDSQIPKPIRDPVDLQNEPAQNVRMTSYSTFPWFSFPTEVTPKMNLSNTNELFDFETVSNIKAPNSCSNKRSPISFSVESIMGTKN